MKIAVVSFYFPPEKGAASQRIWNMAAALSDRGNDVSVLCPHPNYPTGKIFEGYGAGVFETETMGKMTIRRHWLYPTNSKKGSLRLFSMLSFSAMLFLSLPFLARKKPDVIIVNSPPLFAGAAGVILSKLLGCKCVLNVSDLWPKSALELGAISAGSKYKLLEGLERFMYKKSHLILTQSEESKAYIKKLMPEASILVYRNLPSFKKHVSTPTKRHPFKIVYAGLLGVAQGVFELIQNVDFKSLDVELHIYGDGNEKEEIQNYISEHRDCNVFYHGFIPLDELERILPDFKASLIPLKTSIQGAFPSKIFSAMNFGLPILFSGAGEGKEFVERYNIGYTNNPGDYIQLKENILKLKSLNDEQNAALKKKARQILQTSFSSEQQVDTLLNSLNRLLSH